jgi:DNA mismatch endonuclease (patch repair protein)
MADVHTPKQRSKNMAAIKGRGNKSTEIKLVKFFKNHKITGWRRHYKKVCGTPDFVFLKNKLAIFVDGCFWHGCEKCNLKPATHTRFWHDKISTNKNRDKIINKKLKNDGWHIVRIWEHNIKRDNSRAFDRILLALGKYN